MLIHVYKSRIDEVKKRLEKVGKKAAKYGVPFSYEILPDVEKTVGIYKYDVANHVHYCDTTYKVIAVPIQISDEPVCSSGWNAVAQIEHFPEGNIVTMFDRDAFAPDAWKTCSSYCDHCGTNRKRRVTYMVVHESGETKQVGSTCLKEYTGINPNACALWAEVASYDEPFETESFGSIPADSLSFNIVEVLAHAVMSIRKDGYRRSDAPGATKEEVKDSMSELRNPDDADWKKAEAISEWLKGLSVTDGTGCEYDVAPIAKQGFCSFRHFGRICYCPVAYDKAMEKAKRDAARAAEQEAQRASSGFVGTVGQRLSFKVSTAVLVTSFPTFYGTTFLYRLIDETGNVFVWFASGAQEISEGATVKGTVKEHKEYNGVKQTVLTRCKVA